MKNIDIIEGQKLKEKFLFEVHVVLVHTMCIHIILWKCCFCKKKNK